MSSGTLVVVSNRLPIAIEDGGDGQRKVLPGSGGLVTALQPVLRKRGGRWIGWMGTHDVELGEAEQLLEQAGVRLGHALGHVALSREDIAGYYHGFANEVLWPLFHDMISRCNFDPSYWPIYESVNRKFAEAIVEQSGPEDFVWVQDYHLMLVARELNKLGASRKLGFFLHIPFPHADLFVNMPWREQLIDGLLRYDLVGFQTARDLHNFLSGVERLRPDAVVRGAGERYRISLEGHTVELGAFPISIDYEDFVQRAVENSVSEMVASIRARLPNRTLILGLDRLDYSKGIPDRIEAFALALEQHPELCGRVTLLQVVVPSRTRVEEYQQLKDEIDRLVGYVNGRFTQAGWTPIQYVFRRLSQTELLSYYRASEVALLTPLKDGMNLVAKEYCACSIEDDGVLILSEFAGAADQLGEHALLVNPHDIEGVADAIYRAVTMEESERRSRMKELRRNVREQNIYGWVDAFLNAASEATLGGTTATSPSETNGPGLRALEIVPPHDVMV